MGLVYDVQISEDGDVKSGNDFNHTELSCCRIFTTRSERKVAGVENVKSVDLELTFEPSWNKDMMSEEANLNWEFYLNLCYEE